MGWEFNQQKWFFKDRSSVKSAIFGIPISYSILGCTILMIILYLVTWLIERKILKRVIGFELPLFIKLFSLFSTLSLLTFLINSTGIIYFVVVSSLFYFITHSLLLSGLLEFFFKFKEYDRPLMNMLYYKPSDHDFFILIAISSLRVLMGLPYSYYSLVLFTMRIAGGNGFIKIPAYVLEKDYISAEIKKLEERYKYVLKRNAVIESR